MTPEPEIQRINIMREKSLHAMLKRWMAQPGDRLEVEVDGFVIDLVRDDLLIEIQTRNFSSMKKKLHKLLETHPVRLVHPVAQDRWIVKTDEDGRVLSRRKSPKHGNYLHVFQELVAIPHLVDHPHFRLEVLLVEDEEIRCNDGKGSWRRKGWSIRDRRLLNVVESRVFTSSGDMLKLLPEGLPDEFTTAELAKQIKQTRAFARKVIYSLKHMGAITQVGKRGRAPVYRIG